MTRLSGTNLERAADHNQRVTLHAIRVNQTLTRVDLANITGLTAPAIANITKRLLADGLIAEDGRRRGGRGQPPTRLIVNPNAAFAVGINIDRDHITLVLVDFLGRTLARRTQEVEFALPAQVQASYRATIDALIAEAGVERDRIVGVGVAIPDELGHVRLPGLSPAYAEWDRVDLHAMFAEPLNLPVFVENDSAAAAMGEQQLGLGHQYPSFFYVLVSWGLGGALVVEGNHFRGATGRSGELGFLMGDDGAGRRAQIQNYVSLAGLSKPLREAGFTILDMLRGEDPRIAPIVDAWIDGAVERLAEPLAAVNCLINPAAVLVGGRLPGRHVERLAERLNTALKVRAANVPALAPVRRAQLSEDAPAVGAAILPFSDLLLPKPGALWKPTDAPLQSAA